MDNLKEIRWRVIEALLNEFPELRTRVREYLREEKDVEEKECIKNWQLQA